MSKAMPCVHHTTTYRFTSQHPRAEKTQLLPSAVPTTDRWMRAAENSAQMGPRQRWCLAKHKRKSNICPSSVASADESTGTFAPLLKPSLLLVVDVAAVGQKTAPSPHATVTTKHLPPSYNGSRILLLEDASNSQNTGPSQEILFPV